MSNMPYKDPIAHREYHREYMKRYRMADCDNYNIKRREYYAKNREKILARKRIWIENNPDKVKQLRQSWFKEHPEAKRQAHYKRNARIKAVDMGDVDIAALISEWDKVCGICKEVVNDLFEVDHVIPIARGGLHTQSNLQLTHPSCNRRKWANV